MIEITQVLTEERIIAIGNGCAMQAAMCFDFRGGKKELMTGPEQEELAVMVMFARAIERAVREATTQADASDPEAKGNISAWLRRRMHNDLVMIPGSLAGQIADHIDALKSQPATQEQAMDARNQTPSDAIRSEAPDAPLAIEDMQSPRMLAGRADYMASWEWDGISSFKVGWENEKPAERERWCAKAEEKSPPSPEAIDAETK